MPLTIPSDEIHERRPEYVPRCHGTQTECDGIARSLTRRRLNSDAAAEPTAVRTIASQVQRHVRRQPLDADLRGLRNSLAENWRSACTAVTRSRIGSSVSSIKLCIYHPWSPSQSNAPAHLQGHPINAAAQPLLPECPCQVERSLASGPRFGIARPWAWITRISPGGQLCGAETRRRDCQCLSPPASWSPAPAPR